MGGHSKRGNTEGALFFFFVCLKATDACCDGTVRKIMEIHVEVTGGNTQVSKRGVHGVRNRRRNASRGLVPSEKKKICLSKYEGGIGSSILIS